MSFTNVITMHPGDYPPLLAAIHDPPPVLYCAGEPAVLQQPAIAVIGSRRCSHFARELARTLARDLAASGAVIVSGLAYGIDAAAHRGALDAHGATVAVLGGGLRRIYPADHGPLARQIVESGGAVVSEYEADQSPRKHHFPARNRIISGLSLGVVIVEAAAKSGSLITGRLALEQGRDVMAVPGRAGNPLAAGCHRFLREGAALVENAQDVLDVLGLESRAVNADAAEEREQPGDDELEILRHIADETTTVDAICSATGLSVAECLARLTGLELRGFVVATEGGYIRRPHS